MVPFILSAAAAGLAGAYRLMAPRSQIFGKTLVGSKDRNQLALTYDDGPNDPYTLHLLDVLAKHNVKATFFLIGKYVRQSPHIVREICEAGHVIGNHTYNHPNLFWASPARVKQEILAAENAINDVAGKAAVSPSIFRPPYGGRSPQVLKTVRSMGFIPVMWSVTCYDWGSTTAEKVESHAVKQIARSTRQGSRGDIILLHDGGDQNMGADRSNTVVATDRLIQRYKGEGRNFVTIPEII